MLIKLKDSILFKNEIKKIDSTLKKVEHVHTKEQLKNLKEELIRLVTLCDEYHDAENRRYVPPIMISDLRTDLAKIRHKIDNLINKIK